MHCPLALQKKPIPGGQSASTVHKGTHWKPKAPGRHPQAVAPTGHSVARSQVSPSSHAVSPTGSRTHSPLTGSQLSLSVQIALVRQSGTHAPSELSQT